MKIHKIGKICLMLSLCIVIFGACKRLNFEPTHLGDPRGEDDYGVEVIGGVESVYFNVTDSLNVAIQLANNLDLPVYVHDGTYDFLINSVPEEGFFGEGIIEFNNAVIYNPDIDFVGIPHNISQQLYTYPNYITEGQIVEPPLASVPDTMPVDIVAHWYNDFGLSRTAMSSTNQYGGYTWYDWRWNHTTNVNYDESRHPLLGWYRGDDVNVLDWICYWLVKYGVDGTILSNQFRTTDWENPADYAHWYYQLFNHVKNFQNLKYSVWLRANHGISQVDAIAGDTDMIDNVLAEYDNVYCHIDSGKRYPVFYAWDMEGFRGTYDAYNGTTNSVARLKTLALSCKALGYDGICVYARNLNTGQFNATVRANLKANDVVLLSQDYSTTYAVPKSESYATYAQDTALFPLDDFRVLNVMTAADTQTPHPSTWNMYGSTPALFQEVLQRAVDVTQSSAKPKTVVIYNVSEWAEGGPGLIPNQRDLFGYLEAISSLDY